MKRYVKATTAEPFIYDGTQSVPKDVTEVIIPDSVTSIGDDAFSRCSSLKSITIPNNVRSIGGFAFYGCSSLKSITIPESVKSIGDYAFYNCESLTSITIPDSVTSIGKRAFSFCKSLTSITIPEGVTSIGDEVFSYCSSLTSITIPDSVTHIGKDAFENCNKLKSFKCSDKVKALIDGSKINNHIDLNEGDDDHEDEWGTIESDDDFYEYMQGFGSDVMDKITEKYPGIEIDYEQNGQGGHYTNDFFGTTPDGNSFSATISDSEVFDYDNYNDIIEYGVNQVISAIESAGDIVTV